MTPMLMYSQKTIRFRLKACHKGLPEIEEKIRTSQCYNALSHLRRILTLKARLCKFRDDNFRGQREGTRSRAIIDRVHERVNAWAAKYRAARAAKLKLSGKGEWEKSLRVLLDDDLRTRSDVKSAKPKQPRCGILEDDLVEQAQVQPPPPPRPQQTEEISLLPKPRDKRDGTGRTRDELSWIWLGVKAKTGNDKDDDEVLRTEWSRSQARARRAKEEVRLLREEMRRVLAYLKWKAGWWKSQIGRRVLDNSLSEGLTAYAECRAMHLLNLALHFKSLWQDPLKEDFNPAEELSSKTGERDGEDMEDWDTDSSEDSD
ncbi:hypothetical protein BJ165DRAFT_1411447 [Panaeolus papilionaceus]|nr:hypothetical protein BJ165DRAFT_1411447 [Panaeolus papilionaceus]